MKKTLALSILATLVFTTSVQAQTFTDLPESNLYHDSIQKLVNKGCISGYEDQTFQPDKLVNRAEAVKIILTCLDLPNIYTEQTFTVPDGTKVSVGNNETQVEGESKVIFKIPFKAENYRDLSFTDIDKNQWYIPYLKEAVVREIITGYDDNTIKPTQAVSKAELYTILYRLTPSDLKPTQEEEEALSDDIASGYWFYEPLQFAIKNGLLTTDDENQISPFKELTRAQVSHFINQYDEWISERIISSDNSTSEETSEEVLADTSEQETETEQEQTSETTESEETTETEPAEQTEDSSSQNTANSDSEYQVGFTESGIASYYGYSFDGRRTASGQVLDVEANMAAHKTLPFGTIVRVTNPTTEKWVDVTIFDRGPFVEGRIIDLTPSTFEHLAPLSSGIVNVELEIISLP
jgi:rare lipoprotein A